MKFSNTVTLSVGANPHRVASLIVCLILGCNEEVHSAADDAGGRRDASLEVLGDARTQDGSPSVVVVEGTPLFPDETITDWVSYMEQLSRVVVLREEELEPPKEVLERGEGYVGRKVVLGISETPWVNRNVSPEAGAIEMLVYGWILMAGQRLRAVGPNGARVEVGGEYWIPLVHYVRGWGPLTPNCIFAVAGSAVAETDTMQITNSVAKLLSSRTPAEMRIALDEAPRDPLVEPFADLPPEERVQAVRDAMRAAGLARR